MITGKPLLMIGAVLFFAPAILNASPVIFIIRHAEKATGSGNDPDLSAEGQKRADALARMLRDAGISGIFTTEFKRSQQTAAPTAKATHISATVVPSNDIRGLIEKLRALTGNGLVVGHGNTIPDVAKELGIQTPVDVPEDDYSELFVITITGKPQLLRLHYPF